MFHHIWNLFWRAFTTSPTLVSSNWAYIVYSIFVFAVGVSRTWHKEGRPKLKPWLSASWWPKIRDGLVAALIGWAFLIGANMVKIVNEDHEVFVSRVKTLKSEKQSVLSELQQERDRNNPKFKVDWLNPVVGRGVKIDHGHRRTYTETYLQVSVLNQGADSVIKEWKETLKLKDGREVEGELIYGGSIHVPVDTLNGRIELPISPSLIEKWSTVPIQRGGRGIGSVIFLFPQQDEKNYRGGTIILKLWDINSGKYEIEAPLAKENQLGELRTMPGMGPNQ